MSYWQLFYHVVWATKNRSPLISDEVEPIIYEIMRAKAIELGGVVFGINGISDHVHMVTSIPPRIAVADFVGQVKGVTSAKYNKRIAEGMARLEWQNEYGVFSFDGKRLANIVGYVEHQKQHHACATTIPILERWDDSGVRMLGEQVLGYAVDDALWRAEMLVL